MGSAEAGEVALIGIERLWGGGHWWGSWAWQVRLFPFPTLKVYGSLGTYCTEELVAVMA